MDRGAWWATVLGIAKSRTQLKWQHACALSHKSRTLLPHMTWFQHLWPSSLWSSASRMSHLRIEMRYCGPAAVPRVYTSCLPFPDSAT